MARSQVTLFQKSVLEKGICTTIYWIVIRKLTVCGTRVLPAKKVIATGVTAHYQVTLDIALRWSADAGTNLVLLTSHSAGVKSIFLKQHLLNACHRSKNECYVLKELY